MTAKPANQPGEVTLQLARKDERLMAAASTAAVVSPLRIKRILVPIDFSDCSRKALQYALPLAKQHQAAVTLLYVVPPPYSAGEYSGLDYAQLELSLKEGGQREL